LWSRQLAAIEEFGLAKEEQFTKSLGLEHGIPSHNTFGKFMPPLAYVFPLGC
jgi:hypothetical protein